MPAQADLRPRALDFKYRPGSAYTVALTGPAGWLDDYDFEATLGGDPLPITEDGDRLLISVTDVVTAAHPVSGGKVPWVLAQTGGNPVLVGDWRPSEQGTTSPTIELDVVLAGPEIALELLVGPVGAAAGVQELLAGVGIQIDSADPSAPVVSLDSSAIRYRHVQSLPASVWTVVHNLGFRPGGIYVEDSAHAEVWPRIEHLDNDTLTLSFFADGSPVAEAGEAYIS